MHNASIHNVRGSRDRLRALSALCKFCRTRHGLPFNNMVTVGSGGPHVMRALRKALGKVMKCASEHKI